MPWPSIKRMSGVIFNFSTAAMQAGASLNESRPGIYGKVNFLTADLVSTKSKSGSFKIIATAMIFLLSLVKEQSRPAISFGFVLIGVNLSFEASFLCSSIA